MKYIHEFTDWTNFRWDAQRLSALLGEVRYKQGLLLGKMSGLGFDVRMEANIETLTADAVKSNAIEGETLDPKQVRSSLARHLGADIGGVVPSSRSIDGIVEIMLDAVRNNDAPLTRERLFGWHAALFPAGYSGLRKITVGGWRTEKSGDMRVVSGLARERVHFEAPSAERVENEMEKFLNWFNACSIDGILKAGIAHFWFVTIHPFEDGNGRIARTIADMLLARTENSRERFYSMSARIEKERSSYYEILEASQKSPKCDITAWLEWFLACLGRAIESSEEVLSSVMRKSRFWQVANSYSLNERQRSVLNRLLDGFVGKFTSSKYAALCKCSQDTALRDIRELLTFGLLVQSDSGGRSTSYKIPLNTSAGFFSS